ncbi:hypothetical protein HHX47_DHR8000205 [Lentinula edodes]|nr:hypothetical protein HHX47_DHR8000205 [Lentinula edodes]
MEEHLVKDMSELLFARGGVSFSPKELQSLQAMLRRKMGHADDAQERDVKDVGLDDRDPRQATLQIMDNDAKTKNYLDLRLKEHIDSFLSEYDSQLEKLALNQIQIPLWKPDLPDLSDDLRQFIQDLKIPRARAPNDHLPDMLLHKLGRFQKNRNLRDRLKGLFDNKNHKLASFRASSEGVSFRKAIEANQKIVTSELQILMLARLTVLQRFISTLRRLGKDTRRMSHKRQWLYLQLHPELLLSRVEGKSKDIFTELIMHIAGVITQEGADAAVHDIILKELINGVLTELRDAVDYRLDTALDECQFTAQQLPSCFRSDDWTVNRPLLRSFIFTGTVVSKPGLTIEINATGAFNDATSQLEYMKELFPPEIWQDKEFEQNGYQHLHKLLNVYIAKIADINPADYNGEVMEFGNVAWPPRGFAFEKLDAEMKERVKTMCHEYLFTSQLSADLGENEIRYVEYGLARFLQQGVIALDEPLVLLACSMWFNNQPKRCGTSLYQTLASRIRDHSPSTGRNGFEEFICFYLQHVFRKPRRLDEVFKFKGENKIGEKLATLVTLHINDYEEELRLIEGKINLGPLPCKIGST